MLRKIVTISYFVCKFKSKSTICSPNSIRIVYNPNSPGYFFRLIYFLCYRENLKN